MFDYANNLRIQFPEDALKYKLVDGLKYKDEVLDELTGNVQVPLPKNRYHLLKLPIIPKPMMIVTVTIKAAQKTALLLFMPLAILMVATVTIIQIGSETISKALRKVRIGR